MNERKKKYIVRKREGVNERESDERWKKRVRDNK